MLALIIPIYKPFDNCSENEKTSFNQLLNVFKNRKIYFIGPENLSINRYKEEVEQETDFNFISFNNHFFADLSGYNALCINKSFYKPFLEYSYILLYQLDAFAFRDDLDYWCSLGYDYVGAPWCEGWGQPKLPLNFIGAGNGGFSLRKVSSFYQISGNKLFMHWYQLKRRIYLGYHQKPYLTRLPILWRLMKSFAHLSDQEDHFWAEEVPRNFKWFKVAPPEVALKFSFEAAPEELFKMNHHQLPFGCHAWEKYGTDFWKQFIPF